MVSYLRNGRSFPIYLGSLAERDKDQRGGVIWLGEPNARNFSVLPQEERRKVFIEGIPFCLWHPAGK